MLHKTKNECDRPIAFRVTLSGVVVAAVAFSLRGPIRLVIGVVLLVLYAGIASISVAETRKTEGHAFQFGSGGYQLSVETKAFRFSFMDSEGAILAPPHADSGIMINHRPVLRVERGDSRDNVFIVETEDGTKARIQFHLEDGHVAVTVTPKKSELHRIAIQLGGMPAAYGLGDHGGYHHSFNLVGDEATEFRIAGRRWVSSFAILPQNQLGGVVFGGKSRSVILGPDQYTMTADTVEPITFHYFLGDPYKIYESYLTLRIREGYPNVKPKFRFFELGWESWAALGWQVNQEMVMQSIADFQRNGYPIRWAVTGSGFWREGGTTTSFGEFGDTFSDPRKFREQLHERDVKWLIGLRTNFVPPGGPYKPYTERRDVNLEVEYFDGNPLSEIAIEKGYFLKDDDGNLFSRPSPVFPLVNCYLLDGRNEAAAKWFAELFEKWNVDGIKEDTMMSVGEEWIDIFNRPQIEIAKNGHLVMARNGSFTAPGTLLRTEDTLGTRSLRHRLPVNYLQYAASGAPNVYSDTIGFRNMDRYSKEVMRHGWLMATTAGLSVGESPTDWAPDQQAMFKKIIDFHYQIGPYLYDAAVKSYETGYPYTLTPLPIAYPHDPATSETPDFQWMAGESLLAVPPAKRPDEDTIDVYLPEGIWFDYETGEQYKGPVMLEDFFMPVDKTPVFVGGKGVMVMREKDEELLRARVYPMEREDEVFVFHHPDGTSKSRIILNGWGEVKPIVIDEDTGKEVQVQERKPEGSISFFIEPGHNYKILETNEGS